MRLLMCATAAALLLGACGPAKEASPPQEAEAKAPPAQAPAPVTPVITPEEWRAAVASTHKAEDSKEISDGVTEYAACFKVSETRKAPSGRFACDHFAFASRDAFRKLRHFTPGFLSRLPATTYLRSYISLPDNEKPLLFLAPRYAERGGWIFLNKVAIMADGEVVLERDFSDHQVKRDQDYPIVIEQFDFIATEPQVAALRQIAAAQKVAVRLTGSKGYVHLKKSDLEFFKKDIATALFIYDQLNEAVKDKVPSGS